MKRLGTVTRTKERGYVLVYQRLFDAPAERVWAAITDPVILARWLCQEIEVDLRLGGAIVIPFHHGTETMRGTIRALEPGRLLEYSWNEDGAPVSVVRWSISQWSSGSRLTMTHTLPSGSTPSLATELGGGWHAILDRLAPALAGSEAAYDPAKVRALEDNYAGLVANARELALDGELSCTPLGAHVVRFARWIDRPVAKVWIGLTDPKVLTNWLGNVEIEPRLGGRFNLTFRDSGFVVMGTITTFEPERALEFTWLEDYGMPQSTVLWEIAEERNGCRLVLTHRFPKDARRKDIVPFLGGWEAFLDVLAQGIDGVFVPYESDEPYAAEYRATYPETGAQSTRPLHRHSEQGAE
jgi:uncharacterized protein YndB with AHSA1/START domain